MHVTGQLSNIRDPAFKKHSSTATPFSRKEHEVSGEGIKAWKVNYKDRENMRVEMVT